MLRMHTASKLLGACRRRWQASVYGGPCRFCFALNVAPLRETKNLRPLKDMPHCEKSKGRSHATTQRKSASDGLFGNVQVDSDRPDLVFPSQTLHLSTRAQ